MDEMLNVYAPRRVKLPFSRIGWALFAILGITTALQIVFAAVATIFFPYMLTTGWFEWALSFVPLYLIAVPLGYLILKPIPTLITPQQKLSFGKFLSFLAMSFAVMYLGNLIGIVMNVGIAAFKGRDYTNPLEDLLAGSSIYIEIFVVVLLAPIMEELIFRKLLIDRVRIFGEGTAILVSGLTFGLFHGNLTQFFYAFGLGCMFAYVYLRTGKLHYTMLLHAIINGFSVFLSQLAGSVPDSSSVLEAGFEDPSALIKAVQGNLPVYLGIALLGIAEVALLIAGILLLIKKRKQVVLFTAPMELPKSGRFKAVFVNWGMGIFALLALGMMTYTAIAL